MSNITVTYQILPTLLVAYFTLMSLGVQALPLTAITPITQLMWRCTGPYSDLEYRDCEKVYYNTAGCFFLEHFARYRPCADICNNVVVHSLYEVECRSYCPDYFKSCQKSTPASASTKPDHMIPHQTPTIYFLPVTLCGTFALMIAVVAVIVLSRMTLRRRRRNQKCLSPSASDLMKPTQELNEPTREATHPSDTVSSSSQE